MSVQENVSVMNARMAVLRLDASKTFDESSIVKQAHDYMGSLNSWVPMVIDASSNHHGIDSLDHALLAHVLRDDHIILIGWHFGDHNRADHLKRIAKDAGLVVFSSLSSIENESTSSSDEVACGKEASDDTTSSCLSHEAHLSSDLNHEAEEMIVFEGRVRSGQQIKSNDSVVIEGNTHSGSEVHANKNIHVKGFCDGVLIAGVLGDKSAKIRCSQFRASLISIAGVYQTHDTFPADIINKPVIIELRDDEFVWRIDPHPESVSDSRS